MDKDKYDLIVIGAGPGGSAAAYFASSDMRVLLIDPRNPVKKPKVCSGGLSPKALVILEKMGALSELIRLGCPKITTLRLGSPSGHLLEGPIPKTSISRGFGYIGPRHLLDEVVKTRALKRGVVPLTGRVSHLTWSGETVQGVVVAGQEIKADYVILACGVSSRGLLLNYKSPHAAENLFYTTQAQCENLEWGNPEAIEIYFEKSISPGYFWVFPQGYGRYTLGCGVRKISGDAYLRERYEAGVRYIRHVCHKDVPPSVMLKDWIIPTDHDNSLRNLRLSHASNVLVVGDAGGFANPFTGEGIYYALKTGQLAGQAVVCSRKNYDSLHLISRYEDSLSDVLADLRISWQIHDLMSDPAFIDRVIVEAARDESLRANWVGAIVNASDKHELMGQLRELIDKSGEKSR